MAEVKAITRLCSPTCARAPVAARRLRRVPHARALGARARCNATQMIQVGDTLPEATLIEKQSEEVKIRDLFAGRLGVLLGMPGEWPVHCATRRVCHSPPLRVLSIGPCAARVQALSRRAAPRHARLFCKAAKYRLFADPRNPCADNGSFRLICRATSSTRTSFALSACMRSRCAASTTRG